MTDTPEQPKTPQYTFMSFVVPDNSNGLPLIGSELSVIRALEGNPLGDIFKGVDYESWSSFQVIFSKPPGKNFMVEALLKSSILGKDYVAIRRGHGNARESMFRVYTFISGEFYSVEEYPPLSDEERQQLQAWMNRPID